MLFARSDLPQTPLEWVVVAACGLFFLCLLLLGILVVRDTVRKRGRWGVNPNSLSLECPRCGDWLPAVRVPKNLRQMLWGGWTCERCGGEIDKWGREADKERE